MASALVLVSLRIYTKNTPLKAKCVLVKIPYFNAWFEGIVPSQTEHFLQILQTELLLKPAFKIVSGITSINRGGIKTKETYQFSYTPKHVNLIKPSCACACGKHEHGQKFNKQQSLQTELQI